MQVFSRRPNVCVVFVVGCILKQFSGLFVFPWFWGEGSQKRHLPADGWCLYGDVIPPPPLTYTHTNTRHGGAGTIAYRISLSPVVVANLWCAPTGKTSACRFERRRGGLGFGGAVGRSRCCGPPAR